MNPFRKSIITQDQHQNILVSAGPGSGKTSLLIDRLIYQMECSGPMDKIVCITYTNAAANEISTRLKERLVDCSQLFIGTIHSFCQKYILVPYMLYLDLRPGVSDWKLITKESLDLNYEVTKFIANRYKISGFQVKQYIKSLSAVEFASSGLYTNYNRKKLTQHAMSDWKTFLLKNNYYTQSDIIYFSYHLLHQQNLAYASDALNSKFNYFFVDEFQDVTPLQDKIFRSFSKATKFFVGDPNQSIYSFSGVDMQTFSNYSEEPSFKSFRLHDNYRSGPNIVTFLSQNQSVEDVQTSQKDPRHILRDRVEIIFKGQSLAQSFKSFVDTVRESKYKDVLVLARKHHEVDKVLKLLNNTTINYEYIINNHEDSRHKRILLGILKVASNLDCPYEKYSAGSEILTAWVLDTQYKHLAKEKVHYTDFMWRTLSVLICDFLAQQIVANCSFADIMPKLSRYISSQSKTLYGKSISSRLRWNFKNWKRASKKPILKQLKIESDQRIQCKTIHESKGTEADAVFLFLNNMNEKQNFEKMDLSSEEGRVLYVAASRAKDYLQVVYDPE